MTYPSKYMQRAPRGHVHAPCPGCGVECVYPKGGVCDDCRGALKKWHTQEAERAAKADERVYYTKERDYGFPHLSHEVERREGVERRYAIREPLLRLHALVSRPLDGGTPWKALEARGDDAYTYTRGDSFGARDWTITRLFPVAVADALRDLYAGIEDSLENAYAQGHAKGRSLLLGLASGDLTSDEFNDEAARLNRPQEER